ncbi:flagellar export chaperone FliS [Mesobacillus boroniphilus]|uniref:Flagellar secretion chaperone FliS n=1 Tax=Mesobacillus boroniphilus TaxID=308892 RepID=A0A944CNR2_9BACI|nr:flagellar export chaperone FliS [Mesobacillus boroniphilus]MBS8265786.1 flagellar export chaperone FliS [Mesobacillus boroniphilus]
MEALTKDVIFKKSPQELTALLYEGIIDNLEQAIELINDKSYVQANAKLQRTNDILHRLGVGLKYEAGPIGQQLDMLYNYMADQIIQANLRKDTTLLREMINLIQPIAQAWSDVLRKKVNVSQSSTVRKVTAYENSVMRVQN